MRDGKRERELEIVNSSNLSPNVVQYEQFLNDTLRGDLKYVNHDVDNFIIIIIIVEKTEAGLRGLCIRGVGVFCGMRIAECGISITYILQKF